MSKDTKAPSRSADQFVVRLPDGMRDRIAEMARRNNRSMNAEIVARLSESFQTAGARVLEYGPQMTGLQLEVEKVEAENKHLTDQIELMRQLLGVQKALLKNAGSYLQATIKTYPKGSNNVLDSLLEIWAHFGSALEKMDWSEIAESTNAINETGSFSTCC
ncbi:Arc family DNA-binding protein [Burkholderia sp. WTPI3]|jgi:hypothetical protein|uniref:Arc family DNA-binding protein n=1 Tax=Burkholderia sp. WTPI3 TaxID=2822167 RepID=UPI000DB38F46|nr:MULTISPECIES: Arc family DNA-binding protein [Burkholderiaceae]PZR46006.1 MAG: hypothetical protein DI523_18825 [Paraburkholderia fungorum]